MKIILIFSSLIILMNGCEKHSDRRIIGNEDYRLVVVNKSKTTIYADYGITYPDTTSSSYNPALDDMYKAESNKKATLMIRCCWESYFTNNLPSDTLMVFIYEAKTLESIPWDTVRARCKYIKRYDLSLADLQKLDWTITYP